MVLISSLLLLVLLSPAHSQQIEGGIEIENEIELPELTTKQDINNIRFVSSDGKFTYYQRTNGSLQFSTNYAVKEVIKLAPHTNYRLIVSNDKKIIFVEADQTYNTYFSIRSPKKLYTIKYGTNEISEVGEGTAIGIHFEDNWISFYDYTARTLTLQNPQNDSLKHTIKLANLLNPFFIPRVEMIDTDTVVYTDLNKQGLPGLLKFQMNAKKISVLYKSDSPNRTLDLCLSDDNDLYITEIGLDPVNKGTNIKKMKGVNLSIDKSILIYSSEENELGSIICNVNPDYLYFIKTFRSSSNKLTYDAVELNLSTKKTKKLSSIEFATNLFVMDKKLLLPYQDKYFIIKGSADMTQFDKLKKGPLDQDTSPGG